MDLRSLLTPVTITLAILNIFCLITSIFYGIYLKFTVVSGIGMSDANIIVH